MPWRAKELCRLWPFYQVQIASGRPRQSARADRSTRCAPRTSFESFVDDTQRGNENVVSARLTNQCSWQAARLIMVPNASNRHAGEHAAVQETHNMPKALTMDQKKSTIALNAKGLRRWTTLPGRHVHGSATSQNCHQTNTQNTLGASARGPTRRSRCTASLPQTPQRGLLPCGRRLLCGVGSRCLVAFSAQSCVLSLSFLPLLNAQESTPRGHGRCRSVRHGWRSGGTATQ